MNLRFENFQTQGPARSQPLGNDGLKSVIIENIDELFFKLYLCTNRTFYEFLLQFQFDVAIPTN